MIEATWSKCIILETYLDIAECAKSVFAVQVAAKHHYYGKDTTALSRWPCVWLYAILINPRYNEKRGSTTWLIKRMRWIDAAMRNYEIGKFRKKMLWILVFLLKRFICLPRVGLRYFRNGSIHSDSWSLYKRPVLITIWRKDLIEPSRRCLYWLRCLIGSGLFLKLELHFIDDLKY